MITIALTNRNREESVIRNCLDSLQAQTNTAFRVILVDYGSNQINVDSLKGVVHCYPFVQLIVCPVNKQLWNKSKALNIALRESMTAYFFTADIDMIFHPNFIEILYQLKSEKEVTYFQVGFLNQKESQNCKSFEDYSVNHLSKKDATGMTLFPSALLKSINGYDEFYHGWGAEDTDIHIRIENCKVPIRFYDKHLLILHQWHEKYYRSVKGTDPFHSTLEKINQQYLQQATLLKRTKANLDFTWGTLSAVADFSHSNFSFSLTNEKNEIDAFLNGTLHYLRGYTIDLELHSHSSYKCLKNEIKQLLGKKYKEFYSFQELNDRLLMTIVCSFRNQPYQYQYSKINQSIRLQIKL